MEPSKPFMVMEQCRMCGEVQKGFYPEGQYPIHRDNSECLYCGHMTCEEINMRLEIDEELMAKYV